MADSQAAAAGRPVFDVVAPLREIPADQRTFSCASLLRCLQQLEHVQQLLGARKPADEETLADQDRILLAWLSAYFQGISGTPSIIHGDLLEAELTASGMLAPFVAPSDPADGPSAAGGISFGVPTNITPDVLCNTASELLRMAAAALVALYVYLNFQAQELAADECLFIYATIAINSCLEPDNAAALDEQMTALAEADMLEHGQQSVWWQAPQTQEQQQQEQPDEQGQQRVEFGCAQVRWLMHYVRGLVLHHMGTVYHLLGDREKQAEVYRAQQKDMQAMVKSLPSHPLAYSLFSRCAMNNQQMPVAVAFLTRGLDAAAAVNDDCGQAVMSFQRAAALLLSGGGPQVDAGEVQQLLKQGEAGRESVLSWFPSRWQAWAIDGEPDRSLVQQKLLPELEKRNGAPLPEEGQVAALAGLLYVTQTPSSLPPGALTQIKAGDDGGDEAAAA